MEMHRLWAAQLDGTISWARQLLGRPEAGQYLMA